MLGIREAAPSFLQDQPSAYCLWWLFIVKGGHKIACNFIELLLALGFNSPVLCKDNAIQVRVTQTLVWDLHQPGDLRVDKDDPVPELCIRIGGSFSESQLGKLKTWAIVMWNYLGRLVLVTRKCLQGLWKLNMNKVVNVWTHPKALKDPVYHVLPCWDRKV